MGKNLSWKRGLQYDFVHRECLKVDAKSWKSLVLAIKIKIQWHGCRLPTSNWLLIRSIHWERLFPRQTLLHIHQSFIQSHPCCTISHKLWSWGEEFGMSTSHAFFNVLPAWYANNARRFVNWTQFSYGWFSDRAPHPKHADLAPWVKFPASPPSITDEGSISIQTIIITGESSSRILQNWPKSLLPGLG